METPALASAGTGNEKVSEKRLPHTIAADPASSASPGARALAKLRGIRDSTLSLTKSALCTAIVLRENKRTGHTWASPSNLADDAKLGLRTVERDLAALVRDGAIERRRRRHNASLLSVNLSALRKRRRGKPAAETPHVVRNEERPDSARGAVVGEPHSARGAVVIPHVVRTVLHKELPNRKENSSSLEEQAQNLLVKKLPETPPERIRQAVRLATLLASSPPRSVSYYSTSVPDVLAHFPDKLRSWLAQEARRRVGDNGDPRCPDLAEELKCLAAENGLPYSGELVWDSIDAAQRRLDAERQVQVELRAGACAL